MGLRLTVDEAAWRAHVAATAARYPGLTPVVKGNGYGFGRARLATLVAAIADECAVGTVHEVHDLPAALRIQVLTPTVAPLPADLRGDVVLTISAPAHLAHLQAHGWQGGVVVKLRSSMRRYGVEPNELAEVVNATRRAGCSVIGFGLHLPLAGTMSDHLAEVQAWLPRLDPTVPLYVSHLDADAYGRLLTEHPTRTFHIRLGTELWHGDKSTLRLTADVVDAHPVATGDRVGYRAVRMAVDGHLVLAAAGSAHGVQPLPDGRSPFHFARRRLELVEPPHMHTSMLIVPAPERHPAVGERVDVQRPLTQTWVDEVEWRT